MTTRIPGGGRFFGRRPSERVRRIRLQRYSEWISDDVAEFLAFWIPVTSRRALRLISVMRRLVLERESDQPGIPRQDAIDDVTSEIIDAIALGEDVDPILRNLTSP